MGRGRVIVGIDYSLTCPSVCVLPADAENFTSASVFFLTDKRKCVGKFGTNITGVEHQAWDTPEQRYENIALWVMEILDDIDEDVVVFIEDYSMGSKGKVFNIAENTGVMKYYLHVSGIPFHTVPPTVIKKFYHGKGNADKEKMTAKFIEETGIDLPNLISPGTKLGSPTTDIVDSYAIARYGIDFLNRP